MATPYNLTETPTYTTNTRSLDIASEVRGATVGSPNAGDLNAPHVDMNNRTAYLKQEQDAEKVKTARNSLKIETLFILLGKWNFSEDAISRYVQFDSPIGNDFGHRLDSGLFGWDVSFEVAKAHTILNGGYSKLHWEFDMSSTDLVSSDRVYGDVYSDLGGSSEIQMFSKDGTDCDTGGVYKSFSGDFTFFPPYPTGSGNWMDFRVRISRTGGAIGKVVSIRNLLLQLQA